MTREGIEKRWFELTREIMPSLASEKAWPVSEDHCFQRILLDNAVRGPWREHIKPPAYRNAEDAVLVRAIALGEAAIAGDYDLAELNCNSLKWRGKLKH